MLLVAFPIYITFVGLHPHRRRLVVQAPMPLWPSCPFVGQLCDRPHRQPFREGSGSHASVGRMMVVSLITALTISIGKITISLLSAFAIVYFRFPFRMGFFWAIFVTLMLPVEVRIGPTYQVVADLGMLNTYAGLTVPLIASATATFLFRQFFLTVPDELVEAARVDGAGPMRFFKDILVPLSATSMAALFVIQFIYGWNQYLWPLLGHHQGRHVPRGHGHQANDFGRRRSHRMEHRHGHRHAGHAATRAGGHAHAKVVCQRPCGYRKVTGTQRIYGFHRTQLGFLNIIKRYGHGKTANQVIHGVNAQIQDGEFIVIVGPSGCGKSTLLRMVAGLEEVSDGQISIGGRVVNDLEPSDRDIAMVFQNYALYPHMSVFDNMAYGLKIKKVPVWTKSSSASMDKRLAKFWSWATCLQRKPKANSRAASASAWPWAAPSCASPRCSYSTNR